MCDRSFDARSIALLEAPLEAWPEPRVTAMDEHAVIGSYDADRIEVQVHAASRSLLVLSEMYYPGWRAEIDGTRVAIHKVNGALRGVVVPSGDSRVILRYLPSSFLLGAILSLLAFGGTLLFGIISWRRTRAVAPESAEMMEKRN